MLGPGRKAAGQSLTFSARITPRFIIIRLRRNTYISVIMRCFDDDDEKCAVGRCRKDADERMEINS